jgi:hypothetical protein
LRQRKDNYGESDYSSSMDTLLFRPKLTVAATLEKNARVFKVFMQNKTKCIGCYLARFCTLQDVAATYNLELESFMAQLQQTVQSDQIQIKKEFKNEELA